MPPYCPSKKCLVLASQEPSLSLQAGLSPRYVSVQLPLASLSRQLAKRSPHNYESHTSNSQFSLAFPWSRLCLLASLTSALWTVFYITLIGYLTSHFSFTLLQTASPVLADSILPANPCWTKLKICSWQTVSWQERYVHILVNIWREYPKHNDFGRTMRSAHYCIAWSQLVQLGICKARLACPEQCKHCKELSRARRDTNRSSINDQFYTLLSIAGTCQFPKHQNLPYHRLSCQKEKKSDICYGDTSHSSCHPME